MDQKACENCFWRSLDGYCTEGGRSPHLCKEACSSYKPISNKNAK